MVMRAICAVAATAVAVPLLSVPASADPVVAGEFTVSGVGANNQITAGPDGNMWVTLDSGTNDVARITPDGTVTEYNSANMTNPVGITADPDGNLWVTQGNGVARFAPGDPVSAQKFTINDISDPRAITTGPDGNLWTGSADKVVKIPPANPAGFTSYGATGLSGARWITASSDGYLWLADFGVAQVVRVATAGTGQTFPIAGGSQGIAAGPDGQVAYSQQGVAPYYIGRRTATSAEEKTPVPGTDPFGVAFGTDGAYWAAQFATNNVGRVTTTGAYSTLAFSANSGPRHLAPGPNNTLWVTLDLAEKVGRVTGVNPPPGPGPGPNPTPDPALTTTITKAPTKVVRTTKARAKVKVRFTGTSGATFECKVVKKPKKQAKVKWRSCTSPKVYRLTKGKYRFLVRSKVGNGVDPTPAKARFRITRR
jgi:virginiamycin B lyase